MGTVSAAVCTIGVSYPNGTPAPVVDAVPVVKEALTSSASHAVSTAVVPAAATGGRSLVWVVTTDTTVWAAFGTAPEAAPNADFLMTAGSTRYFAAVPGHKISVEDA